MRIALPNFILLPAAAIAAACTVTAVPPTEADTNREKVFALEKEVARLESRIAELEGAVATATRPSTRIDGQPVPADVLAAAPLATALAFGRFGGAVDASGDGVLDTLRIYLQPRDGRGEVVQVAGRATVTATWIDASGTSTPVATADLAPVAWRDAFRSGFLGTHYTVEVPLAAAVVPPGTLLVRASVIDELTGRTLVAEESIAVAAPSR